jgi:hypothetical protein
MGRPARTTVDRESPVEGAQAGQEDEKIAVTLHLRADTLATVDAFCRGCERGGMDRDKMLRLLVETGIIYWQVQEGRPRRRRSSKDRRSK